MIAVNRKVTLTNFGIRLSVKYCKYRFKKN